MQYAIDPVNVSHERLQDEVIVINLGSGAYYSGTGTAADLWTLVASGMSSDRVVAMLSDAYAAHRDIVAGDVEACLQSLVERGVLMVAEPVVAATAMELPPMARDSWQAPVFDEYTDMWDLLQADPIHDVGEAGWPYAMPQKP